MCICSKRAYSARETKYGGHQSTVQNVQSGNGPRLQNHSWEAALGANS